MQFVLCLSVFRFSFILAWFIIGLIRKDSNKVINLSVARIKDLLIFFNIGNQMKGNVILVRKMKIIYTIISGIKFHLNRKKLLELVGFFSAFAYLFLYCVYKFIKF